MKFNPVSVALEERFLLQKEYLGENKPVNQIHPLVSVTVATYQHVNYIKQCLEGILMQKTNFPYEIIVGEDGSVDGTQDICKEYAEKYPDKIRLYIRDRKLSQFVAENGEVTRFNGIWNRMSARGKYIAWCEGDDYWIDPLKLQKQFDFLESHLDYGLVHTDFNIISESNIKEYRIRRKLGERQNVLEQILLGNYDIGTLTVMFRKDLYDSLPKYYLSKKFPMGDLPLWIEFAAVAKIKYISDVTANYRRLDSSASHSTNFCKRMAFIDALFDCRLYYLQKLGFFQLENQLMRSHILIKLKVAAIERKKKESRLFFFAFLKKNNMKISLKSLYYLFVAYCPFISKILSRVL